MRFLYFLSLLFFPLVLTAQDFSIESYLVDMELRKNGSIEVREQITVDFEQPKQGIFRMLPYRYRIASPKPGEESAQAMATDGTYRYLLYEDIEVLGDEVKQSEEYGNIKLRIGTAGNYHEGEKRYEIRYTIWGAVKQFSDHQEIPLDLIGTQWQAPIEKAKIQLRLAGAPALPPANVQLVGGAQGAQRTDLASYSYSAGVLTVRNEQPLNAKEGISLFLRLPENYISNPQIPITKLADDFYVEKLDIDAQLLEDGSLLVEERWDLRDLPHISASLSFSVRNELRGPEGTSLVFKKMQAHWTPQGGTKKAVEVVESNSDRFFNYELSIASLFQQNGQLRLRYKVWGAALDSTFLWNTPMFEKGRPIEKVRLSLRYPETYTQLQEGWRLPTGTIKKISPGRIELESRHRLGAWSANIWTLQNEELPAGWINMFAVPVEVFTQRYYFKDVETNLRFEEDGSFYFAQGQSVEYVKPDDYQTEDFRLRIPIKRVKSKEEVIDPYLKSPDGNPFRRDYSWLIWDLNHTVGQLIKSSYHTTIDWRNPSEAMPYKYSYATYGLWSIEKDKALFSYPIFPAREEPTEGFSLKLQVPEGWEEGIYRLVYVREGGWRKAYSEPLAVQVLQVEEEAFQVELSSTIQDDIVVYLEIELPAKLLGSSWSKEAQLYLNNYFFLILPLFLALVLLILWLIFGRDKRDSLVVQYLPPEDVTPAEAGLLWDAKLHDRDLTALIYYWAGRGHLRIEETKHDLILHKLSGLPSSAHKFEKTLFKGFFGEKKKEAKLFYLRNRFYVHLRKARKEFQDYSERKRLFVPGSIGFGGILRTLSIGFGLTGIIFYLMPYQFGFNEHRIDVIFSALTCLVLLYAFGKIMPRYGHLGKERFEELRGFREFIKRCEQDRLKRLLDEQPNYFDLTISYAIVLGLGHLWAKKFEGLLQKPPSWYQGYESSSFNSVAFTQHAISKMYDMSESMSSQPASSGGSYSSSSSSSSSSSWSSSSWSSSSSSSYSSSSSFSSSSSSSGGGFGGGGGGSW